MCGGHGSFCSAPAEAIQRLTGKGNPTIWRWQARFMAEGVDGLLHDAKRPGRKPPLAPATIERVLAMTLAAPLGEASQPIVIDWPNACCGDPAADDFTVQGVVPRLSCDPTPGRVPGMGP